MMFGRADEEIQALKTHHIEVEVVPGITAALAGAAAIQQSLTLRGVSRSVAFVTSAQANEVIENVESNSTENQSQPLQSPNADTLVYYMGRKDAANIAQRLMQESPNKAADTPVHILEAVSTKNERHWSSTLGELAIGKAYNWFDSASPALIMVGEALREDQQVMNQTAAQTSNQDLSLQSPCAKFDDGLQNSLILTDSRRSA
jgi:uroporphyrin-III C-methyltransferase